jgi:hypothetical protein
MGNRYPIKQSWWFTVFSVPLGARHGAVEVDEHQVVVRFGAMFRARIDRSAITAVRSESRRVISAGAHGFRGRWLVNGAGTGLVVVTIVPRQRAWVTGFPIRLRELWISLDDPIGFVAELSAGLS